MLEYKFDVQLLIEGDNLDENAVSRTISQMGTTGFPFFLCVHSFLSIIYGTVFSF